jgi:hypothetical protein
MEMYPDETVWCRPLFRTVGEGGAGEHESGGVDTGE